VIRLFRRHRASCPHTSETERRCRCPIYAEGKLNDERLPKTALNLTSWEAAQKWVRDREVAGTLKFKKEEVAFQEAQSQFIADLAARNVSTASIRKFEILLGLLGAYMDAKGFRRLSELGLAEMRQFRASWTWGPLTQSKYVERLKSFFRFCQQCKWIGDNPTAFLKPPRLEVRRVSSDMVFNEEQLKNIYAATKRPSFTALMLLLQYSGLRISDVVKLEKRHIQDGKLMIQTQKTNEIVWLPLPPFVLNALDGIGNSQYFFWTGNGKLSTAINNWRQDLADLFEAVQIKGSAHKFRHTFITNLLACGTPVDRVARIAGNSPRIIEKHYRHWIKEMQEQIEKDVTRMWPKAKLEVVNR